MLNLKRYSHYIIIVVLAMLLIIIAQLRGGSATWADNSNQGTLPQITPTSGGGGSGSGGGEGTGNASKIIGTVTDLSTGKAGAGFVVRINNDEVRTDSFGDYSLSGLAAGEYTVSLVLKGEAVSAQEPITVQLDSVNEVVINLDFYSTPPPGGVPTATSTPAGNVTATAEQVAPESTLAPAGNVTATAEQVAPESTLAPAGNVTVTAEQATPEPDQSATTESVQPPEMPQSGGHIGYSWQLLLGAGVLLLALGLKLAVWVKVE